MNTAVTAGKRSGNFYGLGTYLGLAGALLAMVALFSVLSSHFLSYDRSMPPMINTNVMPTASTIKSGIWLARVLKVSYDRK